MSRASCEAASLRCFHWLRQKALHNINHTSTELSDQMHACVCVSGRKTWIWCRRCTWILGTARPTAHEITAWRLLRGTKVGHVAWRWLRPWFDKRWQRTGGFVGPLGTVDSFSRVAKKDHASSASFFPALFFRWSVEVRRHFCRCWVPLGSSPPTYLGAAFLSTRLHGETLPTRK